MNCLNFAVLTLAISAASWASAPEPVLAPCDRCEQIYRDIPSALSSQTTLPHTDGERLQLHGTVRNSAGVPVAGVVVYVHHTNALGRYPGANSDSPHGLLRGWAKSDASGRYGFDTIRPASYPLRPAQPGEPAHIHMQILEPDRCSYYIDDVWFADDPLLTDTQRSQARARPRGGTGLQSAHRVAGVWQIKRDIVLGQNVANYGECTEQR